MTHFSNRRDFLRTSLLGGLAAVGAPRLASVVHAANEGTFLNPTSRVALFHGEDRPNGLRWLQAGRRWGMSDKNYSQNGRIKWLLNLGFSDRFGQY